jgi:phage shock protein A
VSDDIVTRLRAVLHNDRSVELMNREAADEIERLRRNTGCARKQGTTQFCAEALDAQREVARLTAERDEAMREAAEARQTIYRLQHELAGCSRAPADGKHTPAGETFMPEAL